MLFRYLKYGFEGNDHSELNQTVNILKNKDMFENDPRMFRMFGGIYQRKYSSCGKGTANKEGGGM